MANTSSRPPLMMAFVCGSTTKWLSNTGGRTPRPQRVSRSDGKRGSHIIKVEFIQIEGRYALDVGLSIHEEAKEKLAKRQANAAVALLKMNQPEKVWPLLKHSPDPRVRSYLIHRLGPLGQTPGRSSKRLERNGHHDSPGVDSRAWASSARRNCRWRTASGAAEVAGDVPDGERPRPSCGFANGCCGHGSRRRG